MTIAEAIRAVLQQSRNGMTSKEIYEEIVRRGLYTFGAQKPVDVVNAQIRRRCNGLDFPTAYPVKAFEIAGYEGKKIKFRLISEQNEEMAVALPKTAGQAEQLPEEKIEAILREHLRMIQQQVFDSILNNSPQFFEHLVLNLLLEMGYGEDKSSGVVTGRSHDGGIDGIISEDKLGLNLIYIQAKRYLVTKKIGRKEIQAFIGAMGNVQKGVFITTSTFTKEASTFAKTQQQKSLKLIDGELLTSLLVKYGVGVNVAQTFSLYKLDMDYFNE